MKVAQYLHKRPRILQDEVYERVGKSVIQVYQRALN